jgi:proline dehydrogenase
MIPPVARRFLAGETAAGALDHATRLDERGVGAILNLLGEHYTDRSNAEADCRAYCQLVEDLARTDLRACLSVKPTQLGLDISESCFREHLDRVVAHAADRDVFVWIDMEDHTTVDATLDAFETQAREYGTVGVCVQANLRRTGDDIDRLANLPGKVRLVKGAYNPPAEVAYQSSERVDEATADYLQQMFRTFEDGVALGSHDPELIALAADLHARYGTPYEIQMLMGVRTGAQYDLAKHHDLWQYAPYGRRWLSYFYRRLTESSESALFALRALLSP